jgi:arsenical pump membrane protein
MANGASLLLPGSNLTNLIVLAHEPLTGADFAREMALPWLAVVLVTIGFVALAFRLGHVDGAAAPVPPLRLGIGASATAAATALMLALHNAAIPVLAVGLAAVALRRLRPKVDAHVLGPLFVLAVALGTLARRWHGPASLLGHLGGVGDAVVGALSSMIVNNLPAATLLSAQKPPHPLPLLIGLNLGPNLLFTGSLSTYLWYHAARATGVRPSLRQSFLLGLVLVPLTMATALGVLGLTQPQAF